MEEERATTLSFHYSATPGFTSVIVPVYDDPSGLRETLGSLQCQTLTKAQYEIIVANDGAQEPISELCQSFQVDEVSIAPRRGSYFARNRALEKARGEYIAFLDADVTVPRNWLEIGRKELQDNDYVGGPVIIDESKIRTPAHVYESMKGFRTEFYFCSEHFCVTANLFVKRRVLEEVGGFDERLRSGGDNEFGKRVSLSGAYRQRYSREIAVLHPPRGFKNLVRKKVRQHKGRILMNRLFPEHYNYRKPRAMELLMSMLAPPRLSSVRKLHSKEAGFSLLDMYVFAWKYKFCKHLNLWRLYYLRDRTQLGEAPW